MSREATFCKDLAKLLDKHKVAICTVELDEAYHQVMFMFNERRDNKSYKTTKYYTKRQHFSAHDAEGRAKLK